MKTKINVTINGRTLPVSFTEPQARIIKRLQNGERCTYINTHWASGGQFVWANNKGEAVGVRAFVGCLDSIRNAFKLTHEAFCNLFNMFII